MREKILKIWVKHRQGQGAGTHLPVKNYDAFVNDLIELFNTELSTPPAEVCEWIPDEDYGSWDTGCGNSFIFNDGTLEDNKARYCQYCGKPIKERKEQP